MREWPNYKVYHLHELEKALKDIDKVKQPEEAEYIESLVLQGGYSPPDNSKISVLSEQKSFSIKIFFILSSLVFLGLFLGLFGAITSGAGHGPYPRFSIMIMLAGLTFAIITFIFLIFYCLYFAIRKLSN